MIKFMFNNYVRIQIDPHTLRHNFGLMGGASDGKLNRKSRRNADAMCGGLDLYSYNREMIHLKKNFPNKTQRY